MGEHIIQELVQKIANLERRLAELESRENLVFNAGNITSGTLSTDRYSAYADLGAENRLGMAQGRVVRGQDARCIPFVNTYWEDFTSVPSSGWTWAGSPFVTPPLVEIKNTTVLYSSGFTNGERSFYYRSAPVTTSSGGFYFLPYLATNQNGQYAGLRLDDGTDDNYIEVVVEWQSAVSPLLYKILYRTGGGSVTTVTATNIPSSPFLPDAIRAAVGGTPWSNWRIEVILYDHYSIIRPGAVTPYISWTPARVGFVAKNGTQTWQESGIDFIAW